jgi:uncharacterized protein YtpQ (UPF0354 family)
MFRDQYIAELKRQESELSVEIKGDLEIELSLADSQHTSYLDNAYREYCLSIDDLAGVLERYAVSAIETLKRSESAEIDTNRIVPVIKDSLYLSEIKQSMLNAGRDLSNFDMYHESLNPYLDVLYAEDTEFNIRYLGTADIKSLGIDSDCLRSNAVENLKRELPPIESHGANGYYMLTAGGNYEASLLLFDSIWNSSNFVVNGEIVVGIPSRDLLFVTGSNDDENINRLRDVCKKVVAESGYSLTSVLFIRKGNMWEEFK